MLFVDNLLHKTASNLSAEELSSIPGHAEEL